MPRDNADAHHDDELARYHRQMLLPVIGVEGQRRLAASSVLVVGVGALGCASAELLARAGVGHLTLIDRDVVEFTNLQRQCLFDERDAHEGVPKAAAAARRLGRINSRIRVTPIVEDFTPQAARRRFASSGEEHAGFDVIMDGTDNFEARYLLNDLAVKFAVPYCYGGVIAARGMAMTVRPGFSACLRCIFDGPPAPGTTPTCDTAGVLGPAVQIVAAFQATQAMKIMLGQGHTTTAGLIEFDLWGSTLRRIGTSRLADAACVCCGRREFEFADHQPAAVTASLCGQNAVQIPAPSPRSIAGSDAEPCRIDLERLAARLRAHGPVVVNEFLLRATLDRELGEAKAPVRITVFPDGRAIVRGLTAPDAARSLYAKYVGA